MQIVLDSYCNSFVALDIMRRKSMITINKAITAVVAVTLVNGIVSTNLFESYKNMYKD